MSTASAGELKGFVSCLDERSKQKAEKELNERNEKDRDSAVKTLQTWILRQDEWLVSPTDYEFLLRFLRVRKFSQLEARKSIENYWTLKTQHPDIAMDMDPQDPIMFELLRQGIYISPQKTDPDGCRLLICNLGGIPLDLVKSKWGKASLYKGFILANEWIMRDENAQVNGVKYIWEYTNLKFETVKYFMGLEKNQLVMKFMSKCMPARVKGIYTMNDPPFVDVVLALFAPFLSKKIRERMVTTGKNLTKLYEYIDKSVLPDEYLPDDHKGPSAGPVQKVIDGMVADMTGPTFRKHIQELCNPKYRAEPGLKSVDLDEVASFRKLSVD